MITCCPDKLIDPVAYEVTEAAELIKTLPPVAGGWLDQTHSHNVAVRFCQGEEAYWKAKALGGGGGGGGGDGDE